MTAKEYTKRVDEWLLSSLDRARAEASVLELKQKSEQFEQEKMTLQRAEDSALRALDRERAEATLLALDRERAEASLLELKQKSDQEKKEIQALLQAEREKNSAAVLAEREKSIAAVQAKREKLLLHLTNESQFNRQKEMHSQQSGQPTANAVGPSDWCFCWYPSSC